MSTQNVFKEIENALVDNVVIIKVAGKAQAFIRKRVYNQQYLEGSTGTAQYSTRPMPVPYGLFVKKFGKALLKKEGTKKRGGKIIASASEFSVFRSKTGKTMVLIQGGYKRWREMNNKNSSPVDLTWSVRMMRNLGILRAEGNTAEIGFSSSSEELKAYYHHAGAGRNKISRKFMGITKTELDELGDLAEKLIFQKMTR